MNYISEIEIDLPRNEVLKLFHNDDFIKSWQPNIKSVTRIKGTKYQKDCVTKFLYDNKGKDFLITETILHTDYPDTYEALYEAKNMKNWEINTLIDTDGKTLWHAKHIFKMSGFMIFLGLFKGMFLKQSNNDMLAFKRAAESRVLEED